MSPLIVCSSGSLGSTRGVAETMAIRSEALRAPTVGVVGAPARRVDAPAKLTGEALYVADLPAPEALVGHTVRSAVPHGVLRAVRLDPGFDWSAVTVVTAEDIPGRNCIVLDSEDQPALVAVGDRVRHAGQAVALVAAPTREAAAAAVAHIALEIDPLPAVLTVEAALEGSVAVTDEGNELAEVTIARGDVDAAFAAADLVVEGTYRTGPAEHLYLEPQGMLARWNADRLHVTGSLQCPFYVHRALVVLFGIDPGAVEVVQAVTGGGFGGKEDQPSMVAAHAALLAHRSGHSVRMVYERGEDIASTTKRHPSVIHHRLAAAADGRLLAADVDVILDGGAFVTLSPLVLLRAVLHVTGPYRIPDVRLRGRAVATNHPPSGAFRGFGGPQALFAAERQVAKVCQALGADPIELRLANALRPGDVTSTGGTVDASAGLPEVLDALRAHLGSSPARPQPAARPVRRGRGIAAAWHGAGFVGDSEAVMGAEVTVDVGQDGSFRVLTSCVDMGQGSRTVLAQLAADALGVALARVDVPEPSTAVVPDTGPTVASRTTLIAGGLVQRAARRLREELLRWGLANGVDGEDPSRLAAAMAAAGERAAVSERYAPPAEARWDRATLSGDAYPTYGWSAVAVDVAVDDDTSEVTVERVVHVVDVGRAINPAAVAGQVHGGTLQALGWALLEHVDRPGGIVPSPSLGTTIIPTAVDAPEVETVIVEVPFEQGPSGAKGVGELPVDGPGPAVANAVEAAIGIAADELPLLPEVLHRLRGPQR
jgi:CO/xanthine dehydrogenase Mo-binding subunit